MDSSGVSSGNGVGITQGQESGTQSQGTVTSHEEWVRNTVLGSLLGGAGGLFLIVLALYCFFWRRHKRGGIHDTIPESSSDKKLGFDPPELRETPPQIRFSPRQFHLFASRPLPQEPRQAPQTPPTAPYLPNPLQHEIPYASQGDSERHIAMVPEETVRKFYEWTTPPQPQTPSPPIAPGNVVPDLPLPRKLIPAHPNSKRDQYQLQNPFE